MGKRANPSSSSKDPPLRIGAEAQDLQQQASAAAKSKGFSRRQRARFARDALAAHLIDRDLNRLDPLHGVNLLKYGPPAAGLKKLPARPKRAPTPPPSPASPKVATPPPSPTSLSSTSDYRPHQPPAVEPPPPPDPKRRWIEAQARLNAYRDQKIDELIERTERNKHVPGVQAKLEEEAERLGEPWIVEEETLDDLVARHTQSKLHQKR